MIFIHIGFEKTGTTAIQDFLDLNMDLLSSKYNLTHPKCLSYKKHPKIVAISIPDKSARLFERLRINSPEKISHFKQTFKPKLLSEINEALISGNNIIISSEHLSSELKTKEDIESFALILSEFKVEKKVIMYIRRQDDFLLSRYSTRIKNGGTENLKILKHHPIYKYHSKIKNWENVFGKDNLVINKYNKDKFYQKNIIYDFLSQIGITDFSIFEFPKNEVNSSLDNKTLFILKEINAFIPHFQDGKMNPLRGNIALDIGELELGSKIKLTEEDRFYILAEFRDENEKLRQDYNLDFISDCIIENTQNSRLQFNEYQKPLKEDIYKVFAYLWEKQQKKILWLLDRVEELESSTIE